jgi:hypothetical protein
MPGPRPYLPYRSSIDTLTARLSVPPTFDFEVFPDAVD